FFSSRRRHTRSKRDWSSDVCSSDLLNGKHYELIVNSKDGFQSEAVTDRYSEVLKKYDYIVGDWGYGQLRLKGFYHPEHGNASYNTRIDMLDEYILEYCNFGCAFFVLKKMDE